MSSVSDHHHEIFYIEISVTDLAKAKQFYSAAFDWEFNDYGPEYAGIKKRSSDGETGGLCVTDKVTIGGPLVVLLSDNLQKSYESVKRAGGKIVTETFEFPGGRRFHFADPDANELAVCCLN